MKGMGPPSLTIRRFGPDDSITSLTALLHRSYQALLDMGFQYWATHQSDEVTRSRIEEGECYVGEIAGEVVATICLNGPDGTGGTPWYDRPDVACVAQFAVEPRLQGRGLGTRLMDFAEARAREKGAAEVALDTAEGASHLIRFYENRGYRSIGHAQWDGVNYRSVILSLRLGEGDVG